MNRGGPLTRRVSLAAASPLARSVGMRRISPRRAREQRTYSKLRASFLAGQGRCGFPGGCASPATEVHHMRGRVGADYLDVTHWIGLCSPHHAWTTEHPAAAIAMGVSESRVAVSAVTH